LELLSLQGKGQTQAYHSKAKAYAKILNGKAKHGQGLSQCLMPWSNVANDSGNGWPHSALRYH